MLYQNDKMLLLPHVLSLLTVTSVSYGFVLLSYPLLANAREHLKLFEIQRQWTYDYQNTVLLNGVQNGTNVGYRITGTLVVESLWNDPIDTNRLLLGFQLKHLKLHIKSRKAPTPEGYASHSSPLDSMTNEKFYVVWKSGVIEHVYIDKTEDASIGNLKKGVASVFQFQLLDGFGKESDACGVCNVRYESINPNVLIKTKSECHRVNARQTRQVNPLLSIEIDQSRETIYTFNFENNYVESIIAQEHHTTSLNFWTKAGSQLHTELRLLFVSSEAIGGPTSSLDDVRLSKSLIQNVLDLREVDDAKNTPSFTQLVAANREFLQAEHLGTVKSANIFTKLVKVARNTNVEELLKVFNSQENKNILLQLYDVLGFAQTTATHTTAMKLLTFEDDSHLDMIERYLWAASMSSNPNVEILKNFLKRARGEVNEKLSETLLHTVAAMAEKINRKGRDESVDVRSFIVNGLEGCEEDNCRRRHLLALKNLKDPKSIPTLLRYVFSKSKVLSVNALKAIKALPESSWTDDVLMSCYKVFYQVGQKFDSSSRTLALDIILKRGPSDTEFFNLIDHLRSNDSAYEIKQYVLQNLLMLGERNDTVKAEFWDKVRSTPQLNNYDVLNQKGHSSALQRRVSTTQSHNVSLESLQEINNGILKRGSVDVVIEQNGVYNQIFSLGLFANGLSSFMSSDESDETDPNESINAGLELTFFDVQIRPFVFFDGQGELMGHVWSGTASEMTPAYQALIMLHDHFETLHLGNGFTAELSVDGAISFDLSGEIQMSLWNRNAQTLIEQSAGILMSSVLRLNTPFITAHIDYNLNTDVKLSLNSNLNFYSGTQLCIRLSQPESTVKFNTFKTERIPDSKHRLRISKYVTYNVAGRTFALNQKNNDMCNVIFSESL